MFSMIPFTDIIFKEDLLMKNFAKMLKKKQNITNMYSHEFEK